jgi:hypothetical protein
MITRVSEPFLDEREVEGPCEETPYGLMPPSIPVCTRCDSLDVEIHTIDSFGGCTDYIEVCHGCRSSYASSDMSAVK